MLRQTLTLLGLTIVALLFVLAACQDRRTRDAGPDTSAPQAPAPVAVPHEALQLGAFADSGSAAAMRDSLALAGWNAYLRPIQQNARTLWRVRVSVGAYEEVTRLTAFSFLARGDTAVRLVSDTIVVTGPRALEVITVNRSVRGMASRTRWALSPDGRTILVTEDVAGTENEALPNGFVLAGETGMRRVRVDSVWDVSPAPGWRAAAFGKAYRISAGEEETLSTGQWERFARRIEMPVRDVRRGGFPVSAMAFIWGFARPGVVDLETGEQRLFPVAGGWRVAWNREGSRLIVGGDPALVQNDAPATSWFAIDAETGQPRGHYPSMPQTAHVSWTEGPVIDISVAADTANRISLPIEGGAVESRGGWIRARGRVIGPGVVLAATRGGRFIVALVPNPDAGEYDARDKLVVYTLSR